MAEAAKSEFNVESFKGDDILEDALNKIFATQNLEQSVFLFNYEFVKNASSELKKRFQAIRNAGGMYLLVPDLETHADCKKKYYFLPKLNPGLALKFYKPEGEDIRFDDCKFGKFKFVYGSKYVKGATLRYIVHDRLCGSIKLKPLSNAYYHIFDDFQLNSFSFQTSVDIHSILLSYFTSIDIGTQIAQVNLPDSFRDFLVKAIQAKDIEPEDIEVKTRSPHVSLERIAGWHSMAEYLEKHIISSDCTNTLVCYDFDRTLTAVRFDTSKNADEDKIRGGKHSLSALKALRDKGATILIVTAGAGNGKSTKNFVDAFENARHYAPLREIFNDNAIDGPQRYQNLYSSKGGANEVLSHILESQKLKTKIPKTTERLFFFDDFLGNALDVYHSFKGKEDSPEVHSVWWSVKKEEEEGYLKPSMGGVDSSDIPELQHAMEMCSDGFSPAPEMENPKITLTSTREEILSALISGETFNFNASAGTFISQILQES